MKLSLTKLVIRMFDTYQTLIKSNKQEYNKLTKSTFYLSSSRESQEQMPNHSLNSNFTNPHKFSILRDKI